MTGEEMKFFKNFATVETMDVWFVKKFCNQEHLVRGNHGWSGLYQYEEAR